MPPIAIIHLIIILESASRPSEIIVYLGNAGLRYFTCLCLVASGHLPSVYNSAMAAA